MSYSYQLSAFVVFFNVLAMALFHGAENLERNTVTDSGLELQAPYPSFFETDHSQV